MMNGVSCSRPSSFILPARKERRLHLLENTGTRSRVEYTSVSRVDLNYSHRNTSMTRVRDGQVIGSRSVRIMSARGLTRVCLWCEPRSCVVVVEPTWGMYSRMAPGRPAFVTVSTRVYSASMIASRGSDQKTHGEDGPDGISGCVVRHNYGLMMIPQSRVFGMPSVTNCLRLPWKRIG